MLYINNLFFHNTPTLNKHNNENIYTYIYSSPEREVTSDSDVLNHDWIWTSLYNANAKHVIPKHFTINVISNVWCIPINLSVDYSNQFKVFCSNPNLAYCIESFLFLSTLISFFVPTASWRHHLWIKKVSFHYILDFAYTVDQRLIPYVSFDQRTSFFSMFAVSPIWFGANKNTDSDQNHLQLKSEFLSVQRIAVLDFKYVVFKGSACICTQNMLKYFT